MDPISTVANYAAVGAFVAASPALLARREDSAARWMVRGTVAGGALGFVVVVGGLSLSRMRAEIAFYALAVGAGLAGTLVGRAVDLHGDALFASGMVPLSLVILIAILREPAAHRDTAGHDARPSSLG